MVGRRRDYCDVRQMLKIWWGEEARQAGHKTNNSVSQQALPSYREHSQWVQSRDNGCWVLLLNTTTLVLLLMSKSFLWTDPCIRVY